MSVFRPAARVTSPDGREWEIYAYRFRWTRPASRRGLPGAAAAALRTLFADDWTIAAIAYVPGETAYTWTTTGEFKGQVLAQVEGHLARGDVPAHLTNAVYRGEDRRSTR
jgi:hypothetical protein